MKYTLVALALLAFLQVIYAQAQVEAIDDELDEELVDLDLADVDHSYHEELVDVDRDYHRKKRCIKPFIKAWLKDVKEVGTCGYYKKLYKIIIKFKTKFHTLVFVVKVCKRPKFGPKAVKIFKCALRRAKKNCLWVGWPKKCVLHGHKVNRKGALVKCLKRVLTKCSNGKVMLIH